MMTTPTARPLSVVTGASSGIGYELAKQFAQNGFDVIMAAEDPGIITAAEDVRGLGVLAQPVQVDLATYQGNEELYSAVTASGRSLDAIAINAGIGVHGDFVRDNDLADELRLLNLNIVSAVHLAKRVLPGMLDRRSGRVLFTSSIAGTMPGPYEATYAASKAFLYSFAEAIRYELRDTGVTVTALMPGPTDTNFFDRAGAMDSKLGSDTKKDDPAEVARQGFEAMMDGKDHVVAGSARNSVQAMAAKLMPAPSAARMHGKMSEPGSAKH
jgi:short-subunit dehydrogenase